MSYRDDTHYIYVMGYDGGPSKIGYSYDPERRLKQIAAEEGINIYITGLWPLGAAVAHTVERYIHWHFRDQHYRREWFNVTPSEVGPIVERALSLGLRPNSLIPAICPVGKKPQFKEGMPIKFVEGTIASMDALLVGDESRSDLIRVAVEREIARRRASVSDQDLTPGFISGDMAASSGSRSRVATGGNPRRQ